MAAVERRAEDPARRSAHSSNGRIDEGTGSTAHGPSVLGRAGRAASRAAGEARGEPPACLKDLNLDQAIAAIVVRWEDYDLAPFFYAPLRDAEEIVFRQEVMRDTERPELAGVIERFARSMRRMRSYLTLVSKLAYQRQREAWHLEAIVLYCEAVHDLDDGLRAGAPTSRGLRAIRDHLVGYVRSEGFLALDGETARLKRDLSQIRYSMTIGAGSVRVRAYEGEEDYGAQVRDTFQRFAQGAVKDHRARYATLQKMGHVEAAVLESVAKLHPDSFAELTGYCERYRSYLDEVIARFDREVQFYMAYHTYIAPIKAVGLQFCYPQVSASREVTATGTFDLPLARKLTGERRQVVTNDWQLQGAERIFVVSGPNQGGKTTFARIFGQLHYLACLGCPVPGSEARLLLFDRLLTHFEKQEDPTSGRGKLEDDLIRVRDILSIATDRTIVVMNESFSSTTLEDARFLGTEVLQRMIALGVLGVYVTFVDELACLDESIVSVTSTVEERDPTVRTFKIVRCPANGLAYAATIADKYGLTYEVLRDRVGS